MGGVIRPGSDITRDIGMVTTVQDRILLDIHTQRDFFVPGGACYTDESRAAAKRVYELFDWVRREDIPVISTLLRVRPGEHVGRSPVRHCVDGTRGERKLARTVLARRVNLGLRNSIDLPAGLFDRYQQVIFEQRDTDLFTHAGAERLVSELPMATFVLCGAEITGGIAQAAIGLRWRGRAVVVAADAVVDLHDARSEMAWRRMEAKGVVFARSADIVAPRRPAVPLRVAGRSAAHRP
jgi:nicotinamidase-related amidase